MNLNLKLIRRWPYWIRHTLVIILLLTWFIPWGIIGHIGRTLMFLAVLMMHGPTAAIKVWMDTK